MKKWLYIICWCIPLNTIQHHHNRYCRVKKPRLINVISFLWYGIKYCDEKRMKIRLCGNYRDVIQAMRNFSDHLNCVHLIVSHPWCLSLYEFDMTPSTQQHGSNINCKAILNITLRGNLLNDNKSPVVITSYNLPQCFNSNSMIYVYKIYILCILWNKPICWFIRFRDKSL